MNKGEITRELIIERSAELFNTQGFSGCSISDIMKATGLKKGGIYNHFENKDDIALAAFDHAFMKVIARFRERLDKDETSEQKLLSVIEVFKSFVHNPVYEGGCPIFNTAADSIGSHPALRKKSAKAFRHLHDYIEIKIKEGIERNEFIKSIETNEIATLFVTSLEGALLISRLNDSMEYIDITSNHLRKHIRKNMILK